MSKKKTASNIIIGIDLGTTNSEIAISVKDSIEIVNNAIGEQYTPSVFGIDKSENKVVGRRAYERLFRSASDDEFQNYKAEVKRLMGTSDRIHFPRANRDYLPEEISAEILKSLKADVLRKYPDASMIGAVISVPAYFDTLQNEATKRAGKLAGFEFVSLLQEPIAAAIAFGFGSEQNENWLVYDFGGGTFDVSVISSRDGILKILEHGGDNFLGGKDIDERIVEEVIKPAILDKFSIFGFDKNNAKYKSIFAKLKAIAECAKIELSTLPKTTIEIDNIGNDDNGEEIYLAFTYNRKEFEKLIKPIVEKTIEVSKRTLNHSGLAKESISRIVFVGGPTQIPFIRKHVEEAVGIKVDTSVDPLTTVVRGACLYGLSERIPQSILNDKHDCKEINEVGLTINYEAMTSEEDELITGNLENYDMDTDYYIQISSDTGFYNSEKIKVKNGKFFDTVAVEKGKSNTFWIYLIDEKGNIIPTYPDSFTITHGMTVSGVPIPHNIGVIYAKRGFDNDFKFSEACDLFFDRNAVPPLKKTKSYKTVRELIQGKDNALPIKVYEGDSLHPDHNLIVTTLKIEGNNLPYNLPTGTDIDITIMINESRELSVEAYIPSIDLEMNARADINYQNVVIEKLQDDLDIVKQRVDDINQFVTDDEADSINFEMEMIQSGISNADDTDAKQKAERDLRVLKGKLDELEDIKSIDQIQQTFEDAVDDARDSISKIRNPELKAQLQEHLIDLEGEGQQAIEKQDKILLGRTIEQLQGVSAQGKFDSPEMWIMLLLMIEENKEMLPDLQTGEYHIGKAKLAISQNDLEELKRHVSELMEMMPREAQNLLSGDMAGIMK